MRYGLIFPGDFLPWDEPLRRGRLSTRVSAAGVALLLEDEIICYLATPYAESLRHRQNLALPGRRRLLLFDSSSEAEDWLAQGQLEEAGWDRGLDSLLAQ